MPPQTSRATKVTRGVATAAVTEMSARRSPIGRRISKFRADEPRAGAAPKATANESGPVATAGRQAA